MTLPAPNLDDRRFQELVDDAKRLVQQRCPGWTDHNVHDPGVTLIETFAYMTDQLLYRLNRVPERVYIKFLDLIGVRLFPPTAARVGVTFWLSGPLPEDVVVSAGTEVATPRASGSESVSFY
jgi:predicted phage baseplate assembly protein